MPVVVNLPSKFQTVYTNILKATPREGTIKLIINELKRQLIEYKLIEKRLEKKYGTSFEEFKRNEIVKRKLFVWGRRGLLRLGTGNRRNRDNQKRGSKHREIYMNLNEFIKYVESASAEYSLKVNILARTENAVKIRLEISPTIFVQSYHHQRYVQLCSRWMG